MAAEGYFKWNDGTPLTVSQENWNDGEPNNAEDEDCVERLENGRWNDLDCSFQRKVLCEKPANY